MTIPHFRTKKINRVQITVGGILKQRRYFKNSQTINLPGDSVTAFVDCQWSGVYSVHAPNADHCDAMVKFQIRTIYKTYCHIVKNNVLNKINYIKQVILSCLRIKYNFLSVVLN